jgi:hypothetical protein
VDSYYRYLRAAGIAKIMTKIEPFTDLPTGAPPLNRRVYTAAKKPFEWLWGFVSWVGQPYLLAWPIAALVSVFLTMLQYSRAPAALSLGQYAFNAFAISLVWAFYLGSVFLAIRLIRAVFNR